MQNSLIKTGLALSLAASITFLQVSPSVAGSNYDFGHYGTNRSRQYQADQSSWSNNSRDKLSDFIQELTSKHTQDKKNNHSPKKEDKKQKKDKSGYTKPDSSDKKKQEYLDNLKEKYKQKDKHEYKNKDTHKPGKTKPSPTPKKEKLKKDYSIDFTKHVVKKQPKKVETIEVYDYKNCKLMVKTIQADSKVKKLHYSLAIYGSFKSTKYAELDGSLSINGSKIGVIDMSKLMAKYGPDHKHGQQYKLTITKDSLKNKHAYKKVVWIKDCKVAEEDDKASDKTPVVVNQDTNKPGDDTGKTLSTNTKNTEVKGASVDRNDSLPATGDIGVLIAQVAGMLLISFGLIAMLVRRIQARIDEQLSV